MLTFVPLIGFRPAGTRTLRERSTATTDGTTLTVLAVAAAADKTDVVVEWQRTGDPASCPPGSQVLAHSNHAPLERGLVAELAVGAARIGATAMRRRSFRMSLASIEAGDAVAFPALPADPTVVELRVSEGAREWRVSLALVIGAVNARALASEIRRDGVVVRATATAREAEELIVGVEVEATHQIRQVGSPIPTPLRFSSTTEDDHRAMTLEHRRVFGEQARPMTLAAGDAETSEEVRRLLSLEPQQSAPGQPFVSRFCVVFEAPSGGAVSATLSVPFIELNDFGPSAAADLRALPADVELGEHQLRVLSAEQHGADQRKIVLETLSASDAPLFVQPARVQGSGPDFAWQRHAADEPSTGRTVIWMATKVGDPPIVAFTGVVLRIDGPLELEIPLA